MEELDIHLSRRWKDALLHTLIFMVIFHAYRYVSPQFTHDSLAFAAETDGPWKIGLGRFMQPVYWKLRGHVAAPYIVGLLSYAYLALSIYMVSDLLDLRLGLSRLLLAGVMTGSLALIATNSAYIHEADCFMLALCLNVLAAWLCLKPTGRLWIAAPVLLAAAMGLYQAYFQVYVALTMVWAIRQLLESDEERACLLTALLRCLRAAALLVAGMLIYAAAWQAVMRATGMQAIDGYNGLTDVGNYENLSIPRLIAETWAYPLRYLLAENSRNAWIVRLARGGLYACAAAGTVYVLVKRRRGALTCAAAMGLVLLLPMGMNCMYVISKGLVHDLIVYAYCLADVLAIAAAESAVGLWAQGGMKRLKRHAARAFLLLFGLLFADKALYANQLYLRKDLEYNATLSVMTRVMDRLEQLDGYQPGTTPVVFCGEMGRSPLVGDSSALLRMKAVEGSSYRYAISSESSYWWYFEDVLNYPIARHPYPSSIRALDAVQAMPVFPQNGSVAMVNGVAVVKISEP